MGKRITTPSWDEAEESQKQANREALKLEAKQSKLIQRQINKETRELKLREKASKEQSAIINPRIFLTSIVCALFLVPAAVLYQTDRLSNLAILLIFVALIIAGETLEIPLIRHKALTLGMIAIPALARTTSQQGAFSLRDTLIVIVAATYCSALILRHENIKTRLLFFANRTITYVVGLIVFREFIDALSFNNVNLYIAVLSSTASMLLVGESINIFAKYMYSKDNTYSFQVQAALISIFAGTTLLAIGFGGTADVAKSNALGINAFWICTIPILVARFSFARYFRVVRNYRETIRALSIAPELGGVVPVGHASRVAHIAVAIARSLKLDEREVEALETAAYLHTLGDAVLDVNIGEDDITELEAANVTAKIVRKTGGLNRVAEIIENHSIPYRGTFNGELVAQNDLTASVLRLANDYEVLSRREESLGKAALNELYTTSNQFTYNPEATIALEKILNDPRNAYLVDPLAFAYSEPPVVAV